ncbi:l-amino-acid oxidase [Phlyctema vagabunda]|uniref:L-amino-acid oxidase n=1 Tax=Phlyctema vagabunda TaxID=108571 RepID=A0ABR4PE20_9HELO
MALRLSFVLMTALAIVPHAVSDPIPHSSVNFRGPFKVEAKGAHNIHVSYNGPSNGELSIYYGPCSIETNEEAHHMVGRTHIGDHLLAKRHSDWVDQKPTKFVWLAPPDIPEGCLHAFIDDVPSGKSEQYQVLKQNPKRASFADIADPMGPWFDGVQYLSQKQPEETFVASTKAKAFGILGGGISGLMTAYLLDSVGIHNWKVLESSGRMGGRIRTSYLNGTRPDEYQYQELGPMRFPHTITDPETNETISIMDQRMIYQLADVLNEINANDPSLVVKFIPWIQTNDNTPVVTSKRRPDGTIPGRMEVLENPALADNLTETYSNVTAVAEAQDALAAWLGLDEETVRGFARNVFQAHKKSVAEGKFDFSEVSYLRNVVGTDLNVTDQVTTTSIHWPAWEFETVYFMATEWRTIDQGLSRLPEAFGPLVRNRTMFNTKVSGVAHNSSTNKVTVTYRPTDTNPLLRSSEIEFDYIFNSVPFNLLRLWKLPKYSSLLRRAIDRLVFDGSVKVALHYRTRFWEHTENPIYGGCGRIETSGIGQICYPSYEINSTGPGVLMASYISSYDATVACAMPEAEHIAYVQRAMVEVHGPVAEEQFTGLYDRHCWELDQHHAGSWAVPIVPQQQLYLPAYWQTEFNTVFIGEHTSFTHSWVFSALESSVRGTVQMLLDLGLVDEAKEINRTWMARWISV